MNLYILQNTDNLDYDTYDSIVVCAESEEEARYIHPCYGSGYDSTVWCNVHSCWETEDISHKSVINLLHKWAYDPTTITVTLIGTAHPSISKGVVHENYVRG